MFAASCRELQASGLAPQQQKSQAEGGHEEAAHFKPVPPRKS
jgi:hypothetical protein